MPEYSYRHGEATLYNRNATTGNPTTAYVEMLEIDQLNFNLSTEKVTRRSKRYPVASKTVSVPVFFDGTGSIMVAENSADILEAAFYGTKNTVAGGSFTDQALPSSLVVGDIVRAPGLRNNITSLVVKDSAGSPATLTLNTHYEVLDLATGKIRILSLGAFTQPFTMSGSEGAGTAVGLLQSRVVEVHMDFSGYNVLQSDRREVVHLYRMQLSPTSEYKIMGDGTEVSSVSFAFDLLQDDKKSSSSTLGQYGSIKIPS